MTAPEPEGEWVTAQQLWDTELLVIVLCRFTGIPLSHDQACIEREAHQHPNVECRTMFFQASALAGVMKLDAFDPLPEQVRRPWTGGEQIGTTHA